jgi:hypothetical protein
MHTQRNEHLGFAISNFIQSNLGVRELFQGYSRTDEGKDYKMLPRPIKNTYSEPSEVKTYEYQLLQSQVKIIIITDYAHA